MSKLQKALFLSDKGYKDLKKAVFACTFDELGYASSFLCYCNDFQRNINSCSKWRKCTVESYLDVMGSRNYSALLVLAAKWLSKDLYCFLSGIQCDKASDCRSFTKTSYEFFQYKGLIRTYHKHDGWLQQYGIITQQYDTAIGSQMELGNNYLYSSCVLWLEISSVCILYCTDCIFDYLVKP